MAAAEDLPVAQQSALHRLQHMAGAGCALTVKGADKAYGH